MTDQPPEDDALARLQAQRDQEWRNVAGWQAQVEQIRCGGGNPTRILAAIDQAEQTITQLTQEILRRLEADHDERERAARKRFADQAIRIRKSLPDKEKE